MLRDAPTRLLVEDQLGRRKFCETLATAMLLESGSPSKVISVEGGWGEGKSSAIEMAIDLIGRRDADRRPFIIRVNPWQVGSRDALVRSMLVELGVIVAGERKTERDARTADLAKQLIGYADALTFLKTEPTSWTLVQAAKLLIGLASFRAQKLLDLESRKERVSQAIDNLDRPIVVVVDDIDRLLPAEVVEVVRFVRAVGNFRRTAYVLAFDQDRVVEALASAGVPSAEKFLEKIVQLRLNLPPVRPTAVRSLLHQALKTLPAFESRHIFPETAFREIEIYDYYLSALIVDVRTLLRVLDKIRILPALIFREVEFWDVFALTALSVVAPSVFERVRRHPHEFVAADHSFGLSLRKDNQARAAAVLQELIGTYPAHVAIALDGLMGKLFPMAGGESSDEKLLESNGRIGASRALFAYLEVGLEDGRVSLDTARRVVTDGDVDGLEIVASTQRGLAELADLVRRELERDGQANFPHAEAVAMAFFMQWKRLYEQGLLSAEEQVSPRVLMPAVRLMVSRAVDPLTILKRLQDRDDESVFTAFLLDAVHDLYFSRGSRQSSPFGREAFNSVVTRFATRVEHYFAAQSFDAEVLGQLLFVLRRVDPLQFDELTERVAKDARGRRTLLSSLGSSIRSGTHGPIATWPEEFTTNLVVIAPLRSEAKAVVREAVKDARLLLTARALVESRQFVIATGEPYRE